MQSENELDLLQEAARLMMNWVKYLKSGFLIIQPKSPKHGHRGLSKLPVRIEIGANVPASEMAMVKFYREYLIRYWPEATDGAEILGAPALIDHLEKEIKDAKALGAWPKEINHRVEIGK